MRWGNIRTGGCNEKCICGFESEDLTRRDHFGNLGLDVNIMLKDSCLHTAVKLAEP